MYRRITVRGPAEYRDCVKIQTFELNYPSRSVHR
jgi:hypothetical protein